MRIGRLFKYLSRYQDIQIMEGDNILALGTINSIRYDVPHFGVSYDELIKKKVLFMCTRDSILFVKVEKNDVECQDERTLL